MDQAGEATLVSDGRAERWHFFGRAGIEALRGADDDTAPAGPAMMRRNERLDHSETAKYDDGGPEGVSVVTSGCHIQ